MVGTNSSFLPIAVLRTASAMYLFASRQQKDVDINQMSKNARNLHYPAHNNDDIELFLLNVINGKDDLKDKRQAYYNRVLKPIGRSACENIIHEILH